MPSATPLSTLGTLDEAGLQVLSAPDLGYADGAEGRLAEIVAEATDLSSASRELADRATDWPTSYSLVPGRANLLRAVDLRPDMRVLEIGCGCGPITRYLGERVGSVDAVEPMAARAKVARLRTRDLDNVSVYVGTLSDVPAEPVYDLVVVVGVLEYIGQGSADPAPYRDFLRQCRAVLADGGTLMVAIENALGVKYLAGAGEDHTNRPFDSLEGYALASPARTFSRERLTALIRESGLEPSTVLGAFPDYKLPRALVADGLFGEAPQLAVRLPRFPSPDWVVPRLQLADEGMLWKTLVEAGVGATFVNSLVVLATKGDGRALWPDDRLAVMFNVERQPWFTVRSEVRRSASGVRVFRERLNPEIEPGPADANPDLRHTPPGDEKVTIGAELLDMMVAEPSRRPELLRAWAALVPDSEWSPVDLVPHNILCTDDGSLVALDQEWWVRGFDRDCLLVRGLLWSVVRLASMTRPESGAPARTVRDVMAELAAELGLDLSDELLERFVAQESRFQAAVNTTNPTEGDRRRRSVEDLWSVMAEDVVQVRGGVRFDLQWQNAVLEMGNAAVRIAALRERIDDLRERIAVLDHELHHSLPARLRRLGGRVRRVLR